MVLYGAGHVPVGSSRGGSKYIQNMHNDDGMAINCSTNQQDTEPKQGWVLYAPALSFNRLIEARQLANHLVDAPSRPFTLPSKVLGLFLIACGLALLLMIAIGFLTGA